MRKNVLLSIILLSFIHLSYSQFNYEFGYNFGNDGYDESGSYITIDDDDNIYMTGHYSGELDFDGTENEYKLTSTGDTSSFLAKYTNDGALIWAISIDGNKSVKSLMVKVDENKNVYITGIVRGDADFDPSINTTIISSPDIITYSYFIAKYNENGNLIWAYGLNPNLNIQHISTISLDTQGNIILGGNFYNTVDFDFSANIYELTAQNINGDNFVAKYNSNGALLWAFNISTNLHAYPVYSSTDENNNIYLAGNFSSTVDFDPSLNTFNLISNGGLDIFIAKYDENGNLIWAKNIGENGADIITDVFYKNNYIHIMGKFNNTVDFDPSINNAFLTTNGSSDIFVAKYDENGDYSWAISISGNTNNICSNMFVDNLNNVYITGHSQYTINFNTSLSNELYTDYKNLYLAIYDSAGQLKYANHWKGSNSFGKSVVSDSKNDIFLLGNFQYNTNVDFDTIIDPFTSDYQNIALAKYDLKKVLGLIYFDIYQNCVFETDEAGLKNRLAIINPGNIVVETNAFGYWYLDSLAEGNYTLTVDTSGIWKTECLNELNFTIQDSQEITRLNDVGLIAKNPCIAPNISINFIFNRPCFEERVYINVCNEILATEILENAYSVLKLDENIELLNANIPYINVGNNSFQFNHDNLLPGECTNYFITIKTACDVVMEQTLCIEGLLYPVSLCVLDTITEKPFPDDFEPCDLPWDKSSISVDGWCENDSLFFSVTNTGEQGNGDMQCFSPVRLYIDGLIVWLDSIQLLGGETKIYAFSGDGRTWRLEVAQHPLHPGFSFPNKTIELCGDIQNWTPHLVNILPHDNLDPVKDVVCNPATFAFDPNDKRGFPQGVGVSNFILPNGNIKYIIRFQNTGNDTAFTVIIRDTLDLNLDIFSVRLGNASHDYTFEMYGPRVLKWTFNNILLPDSTTDFEGSIGFVDFTVSQVKDLPDGIEINNTADIYFDFNEPVITNTTSHIIDRGLKNKKWAVEKHITVGKCIGDTYTHNEYTYANAGVFWQIATGINNQDTLINLSLADIYVDTSIAIVNQNELIAQTSELYQWLDCNNNFQVISGQTSQSFTAIESGIYAVEITQNGCVDTSSCYNLVIGNVLSFNSGVKFSAYPNPSSGFINIKTLENGSFTILDATGRIVYQSLITQQISTHYIQYLSSGIYYMEFSSNNDFYIQKLILEH
jgi:uncharacterized repeat protein (TIGR01451 family)